MRDLIKLMLNEADQATMRAYRAGVPMLVGTDSGVDNSYMFPGFSIHEELQNLVGLGFTSADVLRMVTINAARWRGEAESEGSVEKGKVADLLLLRSNPLTSIRHTQEIDGAAHSGKFYSRLDLDRMLERARKKRTPRTARRKPGAVSDVPEKVAVMALFAVASCCCSRVIGNWTLPAE